MSALAMAGPAPNFGVPYANLHYCAEFWTARALAVGRPALAWMSSLAAIMLNRMREDPLQENKFTELL
jgi:hypothetical protein